MIVLQSVFAGIRFRPNLREIIQRSVKINLSAVEVGESTKLAPFTVSPVHQRLLAMGVGPGTEVRVLRKLPWQGNLYCRIGDRNFALREAEASLILVEQY